jgi:hypothetical protein
MIGVKERFLSKVDYSNPDGCWIWTGGTSTDGYGRLKVGGIYMRAHRLSYEFFKGPIPEGLMVRHRCPVQDNRLCVNPDHLIVGTHQDNMDDLTLSGNSIKVVISPLIVEQILELGNGTRHYPISEIVRVTGVSRCIVESTLNRSRLTLKRTVNSRDCRAFQP